MFTVMVIVRYIEDLLCSFIQSYLLDAYCVLDIVLIRLVASFPTNNRENRGSER